MAGSLLLVAGQERAITDLSILEPINEKEQEKAVELYRFLYYEAGGAGPYEVYRNKDLSNTLFDRVQNFKLSFDNSYNPGWEYKPVKEEKYTATFQASLQHRLTQLKDFSNLINDDEYYALRTEQDEINQRNPGGINTRSEDGSRSGELFKRMREISKTLTPEPITPPDAVTFEFTPDPEANYQQVYTGFNAPKNSSRKIFTDAKEVRKSWLSRALEPDVLDSILSQVNFETQTLITYPIGKRTNASGKLYITAVDFDPIPQSLFISNRIGVINKSCDYTSAVSYPFALIVTEKIPTDILGGGFSTGNFGDGCREPVAGTPTD